MKLTPKERAFAAAYVKDPERVGSRAAKAARYGSPRVAAQSVLKRPHVKALIAKMEAEARKRLKVKKPPKPVDVEVLPPPKAVLPHTALAQHQEQHAIGVRAEVLGMALNTVRAHATRRIGDLYEMTKGGNLVTSPKKILEMPLATLAALTHDQVGDGDLRLRDPLAAGKILLDDCYRQHGDEDPMAGPRQVVNILMFEGTKKDRQDFDRLARRMAKLGANGSGGQG